jgi:mannose-1-phosphate guanylyltransferase
MSATSLSVAEVPVLVLAGGMGTRLRAVYESGPKALAPVAGKPFLARLLSWLERGGFRRVILCVGFGAEQVRTFAADGTAFGLSIEYSQETEPLGTGGALRLAAARHAGETRFLALNGDSAVRVDFSAMLHAHESAGARATLAFAPCPAGGRYGRLECDAGGRVTGFFEKGSRLSSGDAINAGVYLFERDVLEAIPADRPVSLEHDVLPALAANSGLLGFPAGPDFVDIGVPEDFARAQLELERILDGGERTTTE